MSTSYGVSFQLRLLNIAIKRRLTSTIPPSPCESTTHLQGMIVGFLSEQSGQDIFQRDIENEFGIRRSTASMMLKRMEQNGLIRREPVPQDARLKRLILTEQANRLHAEIGQQMNSIDLELCQGIPPEELETCLRVLRQMRKNIEKSEKTTVKTGGKDSL